MTKCTHTSCAIKYKYIIYINTFQIRVKNLVNSLRWCCQLLSKVRVPSIHLLHSNWTFCSSLQFFVSHFSLQNVNIHLSHFLRRKYDKVRLKITDLIWVRFRYIDTYIFAAKRDAFFPLTRYTFVRSENTVFKVPSLFFIHQEIVNNDVGAFYRL